MERHGSGLPCDAPIEGGCVVQLMAHAHVVVRGCRAGTLCRGAAFSFGQGDRLDYRATKSAFSDQESLVKTPARTFTQLLPVGALSQSEDMIRVSVGYAYRGIGAPA
eukprot:1194763-Prorocentrum_minimum.AAC.4